MSPKPYLLISLDEQQIKLVSNNATCFRIARNTFVEEKKWVIPAEACGGATWSPHNDRQNVRCQIAFNAPLLTDKMIHKLGDKIDKELEQANLVCDVKISIK